MFTKNLAKLFFYQKVDETISEMKKLLLKMPIRSGVDVSSDKEKKLTDSLEKKITDLIKEILKKTSLKEFLEE